MVNFFRDEVIVHEEHFGICDDEDENLKTPAYTDTDSSNIGNWIARVSNSAHKPIGFIAVDNKIEILRPDGNMDQRCDAMLHNEDYVVFVELKDQRRNWSDHAIEQLTSTINHFKSNHAISNYKHRLAYVCNKSHPAFQVSMKERMQKFKNIHNIRLIICRDINLK